jgi:cytochrome b pre-mRNA-processing protein 3
MRRSQGDRENVSASRVNLMILQLFRSSPPAPNIRDLYGAIVAQARRPGFYAGYGVPDTVEGRFDLLVLHLVLVLGQIGPPVAQNGRQAKGAGQAIGQRLFDEFCRDLDDNLREMGVGDLAVPKRMRGFAEAFYGRQAAYLAALAAPDRRELENALARNIFNEAKAGHPSDPGSVPASAARLAAYVRAALSQFKAQDQFEAALWRGQVVFPEPEAISVPITEAIQNG